MLTVEVKTCVLTRITLKLTISRTNILSTEGPTQHYLVRDLNTAEETITGGDYMKKRIGPVFLA